MNKLVTALPKGRLLSPVIESLQKAGLISKELDIDLISRKLVFNDKKNNSFLLAKPKDVPAYVEHGAADIGITGKDVIEENERNIYELLDLGYGECNLVVAVPADSGIKTIYDIPEHSRVASSYPNISENFFKKNGIQVELIYLNGSVELAPQVGISDFIVDISSSGKTLAKNDLIPIAEIIKSSARLIVNNVSYKTRHNEIIELVNRINNGRNNDAGNQVS